MSKDQHKPEVSRFSVAFTHFVITWNQLEDQARELLISTAHDEPITLRAVVVNLNTLPLQDGLKTIAHVLSTRRESSALLGEHLQHFVTAMDRLREYRNFYVHSIRGMGRKADDPG